MPKDKSDPRTVRQARVSSLDSAMRQLAAAFGNGLAAADPGTAQAKAALSA